MRNCWQRLREWNRPQVSAYSKDVQDTSKKWLHCILSGFLSGKRSVAGCGFVGLPIWGFPPTFITEHFFIFENLQAYGSHG